MPHSTCDLHLPGRLIVWTMRHWARAHRRRDDLPRYVLHTIRQLPNGEAVQHRLEALLGALALGARRPLAFAPPDCDRLSRDEHSVLTALLASRLGLGDSVRLTLADLQTARGLRTSAEAAADLARALERGQLSIAPLQDHLQALPSRWSAPVRAC